MWVPHSGAYIQFWYLFESLPPVCGGSKEGTVTHYSISQTGDGFGTTQPINLSPSQPNVETLPVALDQAGPVLLDHILGQGSCPPSLHLISLMPRAPQGPSPGQSLLLLFHP